MHLSRGPGVGGGGGESTHYCSDTSIDLSQTKNYIISRLKFSWVIVLLLYRHSTMDKNNSS